MACGELACKGGAFWTEGIWKGFKEKFQLEAVMPDVLQFPLSDFIMPWLRYFVETYWSYLNSLGYTDMKVRGQRTASMANTPNPSHGDESAFEDVAELLVKTCWHGGSYNANPCATVLLCCLGRLSRFSLLNPVNR